jgi:hypothetical protein
MAKEVQGEKNSSLPLQRRRTPRARKKTVHLLQRQKKMEGKKLKLFTMIFAMMFKQGI